MKREGMMGEGMMGDTRISGILLDLFEKEEEKEKKE
jgi:hypothetical protein